LSEEGATRFSTCPESSSVETVELVVDVVVEVVVEAELVTGVLGVVVVVDEPPGLAAEVCDWGLEVVEVCGEFPQPASAPIRQRAEAPIRTVLTFKVSPSFWEWLMLIETRRLDVMRCNAQRAVLLIVRTCKDMCEAHLRVVYLSPLCQ
jgi:hypothetical protein